MFDNVLDLHFMYANTLRRREIYVITWAPMWEDQVSVHEMEEKMQTTFLLSHVANQLQRKFHRTPYPN